MSSRKNRRGNSPPEVAGNGLIDRRALLGRGMLIAGAMGTGVSNLAHRRGRRTASGRSVESRDRHRHPAL